VKKAWRLVLLLIIVATYAAASPFGYGAFALLRLLPTRNQTRRARRLQGVLRRAFTILHDWLRVWSLLDFDPRRSAGQLPDGPAVLVANHPAMSDITSAIACFRNVTTAVKPILFRRYWLRPLLEGARFFEGAGDPLDAGSVIDAGVERIREGFHVLIFPEGTRSPEHGLHRFGRTAFEIACRANVPVVPIVIACDPVWLSKTRGIFSLPNDTPHLTLTALAPVLPADHGFSSRRLRDVVEAHVRSRLGVTHVQAGDHWHGTNAATGARIAGQEAHRGVLDA
jgi:1-acyl-sn-glycerol-3-phosphate acyltransferase